MTVRVSLRSVPSLPPPSRQLDDPRRRLAHRRNLIGQQRSSRPLRLPLSSQRDHAPQAPDWPAGSGERPDGRVERLAGGRGRLDVWQLLEV